MFLFFHFEEDQKHKTVLGFIKVSSEYKKNIINQTLYNVFFSNLMYSKEKEIIHIRQLSSYSVFGSVLGVLCQLSN